MTEIRHNQLSKAPYNKTLHFQFKMSNKNYDSIIRNIFSRIVASSFDLYYSYVITK
jgi:hypothetical protein